MFGSPYHLRGGNCYFCFLYLSFVFGRRGNACETNLYHTRYSSLKPARNANRKLRWLKFSINISRPKRTAYMLIFVYCMCVCVLCVYVKCACSSLLYVAMSANVVKNVKAIYVD